MVEQPERVTKKQIIEQKRGSQAWEDIQEIAKLGDDDQKEYRTIARGLNTMIQVNSLGQTLGFLLAKSKKKKEKDQKNGNQPAQSQQLDEKPTVYGRLLTHLTCWMHKEFNSSIVLSTEPTQKGLLTWLLQDATRADYRRATTECLAYGIWLSRFAEAELKSDDSPNQTPQGGQ